jgi:hypothetical protein
MASTAPNQYPVFLTGEQRERFEDICRNGRASAKKIRHAQVLLLSNHHRLEGRLTGEQIARTLGMHINSVARIRKQFAQEGEAPALERKRRETPPTQPIIDGQAEAHLIAICCSDPPDGRVCWTMQMLADTLIKRRVVMQVSAETVRRALKKRATAVA